MRHLSIIAGVVLLASACHPATEQSSVEIRNARSPATPPGAGVGAVYAELRATRSDKLLGADTPAAERVEIHSTTEQDGMMHMRPVTAVDLAAESSVRFEPGGMHLMLLGLHEPLVAHGTFPVTFHFESAGDVTVDIAVVPPGDASDWN